MADVERIVGRILVVPELLGRAGVDSPDVVRRGHVEDAVRQNRRRLDLWLLAGLEAPNLLELADVFRSNPSKAGMPLTVVTAVKGQPAIGGRVKQVLGIDTLGLDAWRSPIGRNDDGESDSRSNTKNSAHVSSNYFNVSK